MRRRLPRCPGVDDLFASAAPRRACFRDARRRRGLLSEFDRDGLPNAGLPLA
jgi:hypothetical protein